MHQYSVISLYYSYYAAERHLQRKAQCNVSLDVSFFCSSVRFWEHINHHIWHYEYNLYSKIFLFVNFNINAAIMKCIYAQRETGSNLEADKYG